MPNSSVKRLLSGFICLVVFVSISVAQPREGTFYVKGKVIEANSENLLEYVNVVLYSVRDSSIVAGTITDVKGNYMLKHTKPGKFYLTADFIGYEKSIVQNVILKPGNEITNLETIKIKPALLGIEEVEVVAERPFVSYQLDKKVVDVSNNPSAQGGTAVDALENVPSVQTDMDGNVSLRGSSSFTVLVDGRPSILSGTDALNQIPSSAIDKIEIITNPSVKYDPDGTTGIINIISKKGKLRGHALVANLSVGTPNTTSAGINYSYRKNKIMFTGGINYRNSVSAMYGITDKSILLFENDDSLSRRFEDSEGERIHGSYSFSGAIDYELFKGNVLRVGASYNNFRFERSSDVHITNSYLDYPDVAWRTKDAFGINPIGMEYSISNRQVFKEDVKHYLYVDFNYKKQDGNELNTLENGLVNSNWIIEPSDFYYINKKSDVYEIDENIRLEVNYQNPFTDNLTFETGYTLRIDTEDQDYTQSEWDQENNIWLLIPEFNNNSEYTRNINAVWALAKGEYLGFGYSAGFRLEHTDRDIMTLTDTFRYNKLGYYPSFALSRDLGGGNTLQATYSRRINRPRSWHMNPFPRLSDGYSLFQPNPDLRPEYANSFEINYQKSWGTSFVSIETFYNHTLNEMERILLEEGDTNVYTIQNLNSETRMGGEISGQIKASKWLSFNPTFSLYNNRQDGELDGENKVVNSISYDGQLFANFMMSSKSRIQLMAYYRGADKELNGEDKAMYWFSAAMRQDFLDRKLTVTLKVDDILGTRVREGITYTESSEIYSKRSRQSPRIIFSLSLRLNQNSDRRNGGGYDSGMSNGGGDDMDMGF